MEDEAIERDARGKRVRQGSGFHQRPIESIPTRNGVAYHWPGF
jgi:hypothetical protein